MNRVFVFALLICLAACGGGSSGGPVINLPDLPLPPVSRLLLSDDHVGFLIASQPISTNPSLASSLQYSQFLYQVNALNEISKVSFLDQQGAPLDLTGNLTFKDVENITPLDVMVMSPDYIMLTVYHRNFDTDDNNDYYNLLVNLANGNVVSAPVGLNPEGNSGRSSLTTLGRDYFPPDARWNDTEDLYVVSVDYDALDLMSTGELITDPDHQEIVDHHSGVPCPVVPEETEPATDTASDPATDTATDTATASDATSDPTPASTSACTTATETEVSTTDTTTTDPQANAVEDLTPTSRALTEQEDEPTPTAIYRMSLAASNTYGLEKISAEDDRPGLGQFVASRSGVIIYRNLDGGDNSYRVLQPNCEDLTGRLSTVLLAPYTSLIVADDDEGESSIFEVTERGMNKLLFSCNGNVTREAFSGYTKRVGSLRLPFNSPSIASYDYAYPYFINDSCDSGQLFPQQVPETQILNPMPPIPGLFSGDVRGLRKSQFFNGSLFCIGYDDGLQLAIAQLDPSQADPVYEFLTIDFGLWLPNFDTLHMLADGHVLFTGKTRTRNEQSTIMLNTLGEETDLSDTLGGLIVFQQIEIISPNAPPVQTLTP